MGFSRPQQAEFRKLVLDAWRQHCLAECGGDRDRAAAAMADKAAHRAWYECELATATGHYSTNGCNRGRDYDLAMAHFEALAGAGVKWGLRVFDGDARRLLHELRKVGAGTVLDERYLRGIARRMQGHGQDAPLPELHTLPREMLIAIMGEAKRFLRRKNHTLAPSSTIGELDGNDLSGNSTQPSPEPEHADCPF